MTSCIMLKEWPLPTLWPGAGAHMSLSAGEGDESMVFGRGVCVSGFRRGGGCLNKEEPAQ